MNKKRGKNVKIYTPINIASDELFKVVSKSKNKDREILEQKKRTKKIVPLKIKI